MPGYLIITSFYKKRRNVIIVIGIFLYYSKIRANHSYFFTLRKNVCSHIITLEVIVMVNYVLKNSLQDHRIVTIMYQRRKEIVQRDIRVMKLTDKDIEVYCYLRHQVRHFKKGNILSAMYMH